MTRDIVAIGIVDLSTCLYSFSHFGPPFTEHDYPPLREHHVVQPSFLNLYVVLETTIVTTHRSPIEDSIEEIHLLSHENVCTPVTPLTLGIPFQDPHVYSFEHQLSLPVTPQALRFPLQCPLSFTPLHWSRSGLFIDLGILSF